MARSVNSLDSHQPGRKNPRKAPLWLRYLRVICTLQTGETSSYQAPKSQTGNKPEQAPSTFQQNSAASGPFHARTRPIPGTFHTAKTSPVHHPDQPDKPKPEPSRDQAPPRGGPPSNTTESQKLPSHSHAQSPKTTISLQASHHRRNL
jgi:hypothetical protein